MGVVLTLSIILAFVWGIGILVVRGSALYEIRTAMTDYQRGPSLYPEAYTAGRVRQAQEVRRRAWMWPAMPFINARADIKKADEMVREHDRKRTEAELKKALRDYELEFDRKLWES